MVQSEAVVRSKAPTVQATFLEDPASVLQSHTLHAHACMTRTLCEGMCNADCCVQAQQGQKPVEAKHTCQYTASDGIGCKHALAMVQ